MTTTAQPASAPPGSLSADRGFCSSRQARWSCLSAALVSALAGFVAFAPALHNEFVYDDLVIIVNNPSVREPGPWYRFWRETFWPRGMIGELYRPLTVASYRANTVLQIGRASCRERV